jgi:tRNA (guanine-N7-)-methyltransferase
MEIGFGGGQFLVDLARNRPKANVLGVEISAPSLKRGASKIKRASLTNVRVVQGSARLLLEALCGPETVREIYVNFPDPWPKPGHHRRRLVKEEFLNLVASRMVAGGLLEIATDHVEYAADIAACLERNPYFESRLNMPHVTEDGERLRTKYELTALREGRPCFYFKWRRNDVPAALDRFKIPEELPMPHVILHTPVSLPEVSRQFTPFQVREGDVHIRLMDGFQSLSGDRLLIEVNVNEEPLRQRVGLVMRRRESGELIIGLHEIGFPRPTIGVQLAIKGLAEWVMGLHAESEIVKSNLKMTVEGRRPEGSSET